MATRVEDLDTPVVTIDLDIMERTIARWQEYCEEHGIINRPHIKTHKIPAIAHMQVAAGANGIACQKLGEAEVFVAAGLKDVLIPYNIVGAQKLERLCRLAKQARMTVSVDSEVCARGISDAAHREAVEINLEVECDTGMQRAGVQTPEEAAVLARIISRLPAVTFQGWMSYPTSAATVEFFEAATRLVARDGIEVPMRSGGGTPHMWKAHTWLPVVNEHRAGTYIFYDRNSVAAGAA
ncbi:MAG TPA: alanine racemase, partial [Chloroflexota bacterium]|nr:alanine racemase [Chloroflexota bacterium]